MSELAEWKAEMRPELERLGVIFEQRFGYPAGANYVAELDPEFEPGADALFPPTLAAFYAEVGEVCLPDIHIGYFIHPAKRLPRSIEWGLPVRSEAGALGEVATFGTDGGGGFLALSRADGTVHHLPPGGLLEGVYTGGLGEPVRIAEDFAGFLARLLTVVKEFAWTGQTAGLRELR